MPYPQDPQSGMDWQQALLAFAPMIAAGFAGQGPGMGAFGQSYARGAAVADEMAQRQQALQQREAAELYAREQDQIETQRREQEQLLRALDMSRALRQDAVNTAMESGAVDPSAFAQAQYGDWLEGIAKALPVVGKNRQLFEARPESWAPLAQTAQVRRLKEPYERLTRKRTPEDIEAMLADTTPKDYFGGRTFADVHRLMAQAGVGWVPEAQDKASLQSKNVRGVLNGQPYEGMANFDPASGAYTVDGQKLTKVKDAPPAPAVRIDASGLKPMQEFAVTEKLAAAWLKEAAASKEMARQFNLMETGLQRFDADRLGGAQAILVTFQKILDPTSVVRESEYARTPQGLSMLSRMEGYADRLTKGGAGVPKADLAEMVETARQFLADQRAATGTQRSRIDAQIEKYKIDPVTIYGLEPQPAGPAPAGVRKIGRFEVLSEK